MQKAQADKLRILALRPLRRRVNFSPQIHQLLLLGVHVHVGGNVGEVSSSHVSALDREAEPESLSSGTYSSLPRMGSVHLPTSLHVRGSVRQGSRCRRQRPPVRKLGRRRRAPRTN
jgi:hypothetical protein